MRGEGPCPEHRRDGWMIAADPDADFLFRPVATKPKMKGALEKRPPLLSRGDCDPRNQPCAENGCTVVDGEHRAATGAVIRGGATTFARFFYRSRINSAAKSLRPGSGCRLQVLAGLAAGSDSTSVGAIHAVPLT